MNNNKKFGEFGSNYDSRENVIESLNTINSEHALKSDGLTLSEFYKKSFNIERAEGIEEYVLVHLTDYMPTNNTIYTPFSTGKLMHMKKLLLKSYRDTVHFAVNGCVGSHGYGDWSNRKYAVIIPLKSFLKKNGDRVLNSRVEDMYIDGSAILPYDTFILCPENELKLLNDSNNLNVIGVSDNNVVPYVNDVLKHMGYNTYDIEAWGYARDTDKKKQNSFSEQLSNYLGRNVPQNTHSQSYQNAEESLLYSLNMVKQQFRFMVDNDLFDLKEIREIERDISQYSYSYERGLTDKGLTQEDLISLRNIAVEEKFKNSDERIKKIYSLLMEYGSGSLADFSAGLGGLHPFAIMQNNKINDYYASIGLSELQLNSHENKTESLWNRVIESYKIDSFIGKKMEDIYNGDILKTNFERLADVYSKIVNDDLFDDVNSMEILQYVTSHLQNDYLLMKKYKNEIETNRPGFHFEEYAKSLDDLLKKYGVNHTILDANQFTETIANNLNRERFVKNSNVKINDFVKENINVKDISKLLNDMVKNSIGLDVMISPELVLFDVTDEQIDYLLNDEQFISRFSVDVDSKEKCVVLPIENLTFGDLKQIYVYIKSINGSLYLEGTNNIKSR